MPDLYQLGEGESVPFKLVASQILPGDKAVVYSHHPKAVIVQQDAIAAPGTSASGMIVGGPVPASAVVIQGTITHPDGTSTVSSFTVDVGGGVPAPPEPPKPPEPITAKILLGQSVAARAKAAEATAPPAGDKK
jgi:hypothetical protein